MPGFVAWLQINYSNQTVTSPDGINWTLRTLPISEYWKGICWSPELSMACVIGEQNIITCNFM